MTDIIICPHVIWKFDVSCLSPFSRSYSRCIQILKSYWRVTVETDEKFAVIKIYFIPEFPDHYQNMYFSVKCGIRDSFGRTKLEILQTATTEHLSTSCVWEAGRVHLINENLIKNNLLWVVCTIEPHSSWEDCLRLADSSVSCCSLSSGPCTGDLIKDFKRLFKDAPQYDVILECENKFIKAHRSILSSRSEMFQGMFRSGLKEALEGKAVIKDVSFNVLEELIRYIYTAEINIENVDFACDVYEAADKFLVKSLKERCINYFKNNLTETFFECNSGAKAMNACKVLCLAYKYEDISLKNWVKAYLAHPPLLVTIEWNLFSKNHQDMALEVYYGLLNKTKHS